MMSHSPGFHVLRLPASPSTGEIVVDGVAHGDTPSVVHPRHRGTRHTWLDSPSTPGLNLDPPSLPLWAVGGGHASGEVEFGLVRPPLGLRLR